MKNMELLKYIVPIYVDDVYQGNGFIGYILTGTKRKIESCSFASQSEKDEEIHRREKSEGMVLVITK